jgi:APA family basic amino acid/polyamine antiporter
MIEATSSDSARDQQPAAPKRQLTLFDSTCIIVGIIIGAGIYETTPLIASSVAGAGLGAGGLVGVWVLGGVLSLLGALCYAELGTAYPKEGGDYVFLSRAFGRAPGFLFAWCQLWIIRPGSIGAMAYVFARYADQLCPLSRLVTRWCDACYSRLAEVPAAWPAAETVGGAVALMVYAAASVAVLSVINVLGVRQGKWTQNLLTTAKVLGLVAIFLAGLWFVAPVAPLEPAPQPGSDVQATPDAAAQPAEPTMEEPKFNWSLFGLAMIFVLFTYGGWNEMAYVGAEVYNPKKNILRALVLGTVAVTLIYVLATLAFVHCLGFARTQKPEATVAQDVLTVAAEDVFRLTTRREALLGELKGLERQPADEVLNRRTEIERWLAWLDRLANLPAHLMCVLICVSALGAVNGMIFTGARIYYAMGTDHRLFAWLGGWSERLGTPVWSLVIQAVLTLVLVVAFGWLVIIGRAQGGFQSMIIFTAPVFWFFLAMVGISVAELRDREPDTPRPYRVQGYPVVPILFCASSLFMLYSSLAYAVENRSWEAFWSVLILLVGVVMCFCDPRPKGQAGNP